MSNPPYIPSDDISGLQAEVGKHEPRLALDGGLDGLDDLLHLCNGAALMLKPSGFFAFEVPISSFVEVEITISFKLQKYSAVEIPSICTSSGIYLKVRSV